MSENPPKRSLIHKDLRTPKYKKRVIPDKKKEEKRNLCRKDKSYERSTEAD